MTQQVVKKKATPSCEYHTLSLLDLYAKKVSCEECGFTEEADELDIEEQYRILDELDKM